MLFGISCTPAITNDIIIRTWVLTVINKVRNGGCQTVAAPSNPINVGNNIIILQMSDIR
jgi:hypothetical protein